MVEALLVASLLISGITAAIYVIVGTLAAQLYDIRQAKARRLKAAHPNARQYRHRPLLSAVVITRNDAENIEECLRNLFKSSYRKLEVIVADNASGDETVKLAKQYQSGHPKHIVKVLAKRKPGDRLLVAQQAYHAYGTGELVLVCNANARPDKYAFARGVEQLAMSPDLEAVSFHTRIDAQQSIMGLLQYYVGLLSNRSKKVISLLVKYHPLTDNEVILFRWPSFKKLGKKVYAQHLGYASHAYMFTNPAVSIDTLLQEVVKRQLLQAKTIRQLIMWKGGKSIVGNQMKILKLLSIISSLIMLIAIPTSVGYVLYLAVGLHETAFAAWLAAGFSIYLLAVIWSDEDENLLQKFRYSLGVPLTYGLFLLMTAVKPLAIIDRRFYSEAQ